MPRWNPYNLPADIDQIEKWKWDDRYDMPRDFVGYGEHSHNPQWPNNAKIAVSFVINYEEGAEHTVLNGDPHSETMINEAPNGPAKLQERDTRVESEYEYGSRVGFWRLFRMFNKHDIKFTLYAVGQALECNPAAGKRSVEMGHDIASHAYRWIDYQGMPPEEEKVYIKKAIESIQDICGAPPKGWFYGRMSPRSVPLVWEVHNEMGIPLVWMSDSYADEVPYWIDIPAEKNESNPKGLLMVPYSYDCNDYKFNMDTGFAGPSDFYEQIKNTFDVLYEEGCDGSPKMMTVALHCRCVGKPARFAALKKFVEYIKEKDDVWIATRTEIAEHFAEKFPYQKGHLIPERQRVETAKNGRVI